MGGGVSLGTFCGTALAQALKLLIVYGRDADQQPFERVEVDVFSGASAGALSLSAMLRSLAAPDAAALAKAREVVQAEFGADFDALTPAAQRDLAAAQVMQDFQWKLWTEEIKIDRLLGSGGDGRLRTKASLLDRGAVEQIARQYVVAAEDELDFSNRCVLAERVLFACTLTNLTPVVCDASGQLPGAEVGFIGLNDGMRSSTHRDLRVFDLNFARVANPGSDFYADRWCLFHDGPAKPGMIGSLTDAATWARIAATAIGSGSFPGAFEPAVLTRKAFEFGPKIWNRMMRRPKTAPFDGQETRDFSYYDGGTLNNEPIREAFRLASFIDGHTRAAEPDAAVQRLIVFVDPNVSETYPSFRLAGHRIWGLDEPNKLGSIDGFDLRRLSSLERLIPHVGALVGAISNEGRVIEADKIAEVHNLFEVRDGIRQALFNTLAATATSAELDRLVKFSMGRLKSSKTDDVIPPGPMTLAGELERVCHEEMDSEWGAALGDLKGKAEAFLASGNMSADPEVKLWLRALAFVAVDLILGMEGKLKDASLVAIAPFRDLANVAKGKPAVPIHLPGGALSGFAGFMSDLPDRVEHAAARYCAAEFLRECGLVDPKTPLPSGSGFALSPEDELQLARDVEAGLSRLVDRVGEMVRDSRFIRLFPGFDLVATKLIGLYAKSKIKGFDWREKQEIVCTFRVRVPNESFELDGRGIGDKDTQPVANSDDGQWDLVTLATWSNGAWSGGFVRDGQLDVDTDGTAFLKDRDFCRIDLPDAKAIAAADLLANPTFALQLKPVHKGKVLPASSWTLESGVTSLEASLLG